MKLAGRLCGAEFVNRDYGRPWGLDIFVGNVLEFFTGQFIKK
jgi:hypothetical protein